MAPGSLKLGPALNFLFIQCYHECFVDVTAEYAWSFNGHNAEAREKLQMLLCIEM